MAVPRGLGTAEINEEGSLNTTGTKGEVPKRSLFISFKAARYNKTARDNLVTQTD